MNTKDKVKDLWRLCFTDSNEFLDLYFEMRYKDEINMAVYEGDKMISALQMIPYPMTFCNEIIATSYISGACTHPDYRQHGAMRRLLNATHRRMYEDGILLSTLIPAEEWLIGYYAQSGYAPGFGYITQQKAVAELHPLTDIEVKECTSPSAEHYRYFDARMKRRNCCIQHSMEDFMVIAADLKLGHGKLLAAYSEGKIAGMVFAVMNGEELCIKELLADNESIEDTLLNSAARAYSVTTLKCFLPSSLDTLSLGMARVIHAEKMLGLFVQKYPAAEWLICIEGDETLPENNGYYTVRQGTCTRTPIEGRKYSTYTIECFTRLLLEGEHPYMSLMLN